MEMIQRAQSKPSVRPNEQQPSFRQLSQKIPQEPGPIKGKSLIAPQKGQNEITYLICVEPGSQIVYTINLLTQEAELLNLNHQEREVFRNKIKREEYKVTQLLDRDQHEKDQWNFENNQTQTYRRSMVPFYLLQQESNKYPLYADNSNLAPDVTKDFLIKKIQVIFNDDKKIFLNQVSLLQTADKLIRTVDKEIIKSGEKKIPNFILKFKEIDSFIYGQTQLIYLQSIREHLRKKEPVLELFLVQQQRNKVSNFPPLFQKVEVKEPQQISMLNLATQNKVSRQSTLQPSLNRQELYQLYKTANIFNWYCPKNMQQQMFYYTNDKTQILQSCKINSPLSITLGCINQLLEMLIDKHTAIRQSVIEIPLIYFKHKTGQNYLIESQLEYLKSKLKIRNLIKDFRFKIKQHEDKHHKALIFKIKPKSVQIQSAIYLGNVRLSTFTYSRALAFGNKITFNDVLYFYKPKQKLWRQVDVNENNMENEEERGEQIFVSNLPSHARICINVILNPELKRGDHEHTGYVLGSCSVSLFDESYLLRQGERQINLWPLQQFDPRMVCQGECFENQKKRFTISLDFTKFANRVGWKLDDQQISKNDENKEVRKQIDEETTGLRLIKKFVDAYPFDPSQNEADISLEIALQYRNYINKLPILIKLVDFLDHSQIKICHDILDSSGIANDMIPEEALALLDGYYGDLNVRIFAVKKLSLLTDTNIALLMPQLIQALKYELFHQSPLAEFLLERALQNTRVVGHAFFWNLKANLSEKRSLERFYLILERFLMCCGQYKNDLYKQNLVNESLIKISQRVKDDFEIRKLSKQQAVDEMNQLLKIEERRIKMSYQLVIAHQIFDDPDFVRNQIKRSELSGGSIDEKVSPRLQNRRSMSPNQERSPDLSQDQPSNLVIQRNSSEQKLKSYEFDSEEIKKFIAQNEGNDDINLQYQLRDVQWYYEILVLPLKPELPISRFASEGSSIFLSAKKPLFILAEIADQQEVIQSINAQQFQQQIKKVIVKKGKPFRFIFKCGDDLKQDSLVLQFFKIMDRLWQSSGLDLNMLCYDVMESGEQTGYLEFVPDAQVITQMHKDYGFWSGPFSKKSVFDYFQKNVANDPQFLQAKSRKELEKRLKDYHDTFIKSFAGQCVATYTLGIRDRHPGNFMLQNKTGKFFHIDFGHFLGHSKYKLGFKRDREPFIYSDELHYFLRHFSDFQILLDKAPETYVISPKKDKLQKSEYDQKEMEFEKFAERAFVRVRRSADIFINLLILMLVSGLNELDYQHIAYLKNALFLDISEEEAIVSFRDKIGEARKQWYRPLDNLFHVISDDRKERKRQKQEKNKNN